MDGKIDFVVVTKGICFLCRNKIEIDTQSESILESIVKRNQSANQSIQYISRYLKMDMSKVFISGGAIPPHLLEKVKRSKLKVEHCDDCSRLNDTFSKLFRKLENAEIEVASCMSKITRKMANADKFGNEEELYKLAQCEPKDAGLLEKLKIAEALWTDAEQKCNHKMKIVGNGPRIRMKKLSPNDFPSKKDIQASRAHEPDNSFGDIDSGPIITPGDESDHWDVSDNMELDSTVSISYHQPAAAMPRQNNRILRSDLSVNAESGRVKCSICSKDFARYPGFQQHYKAVHLKVRYNCKVCHADFSNKYNLTTHQRSAHFGQRFKCQFCSKIFSHASTRCRHMKVCRNWSRRRQITAQANKLDVDVSETLKVNEVTESNFKQETGDGDDQDEQTNFL